MPLAAIPMAIGAAGSIGSGMSGKKAQKQANSLAQTQLGLEQGLLRNATPASNFWQSLLHGGQAAVQATGPIASQIGQAAQGARNSIMATTPRGGEQNLAMAQSFNDASNNIARLYAGMQPAAAQGLGSLAGLGANLAFPASMSGMGAAQMGMQNAQSGASGFGSMLYNSLNKIRQGNGAGMGGGAGKQAQPAYPGTGGIS